MGISHLTRFGWILKPAYLAAENPMAQTEKWQKVDQNQEVDSVVKQLKITQAHISIWRLLASSKPHCQALIDLLSQYQVPIATNPHTLTNLVASLKAHQCISFTNEHSHRGNSWHTNALHITIYTMGKRVSMALIGNGSTINVCILRTLAVIGLSQDDFHPLCQALRA